MLWQLPFFRFAFSRIKYFLLLEMSPFTLQNRFIYVKAFTEKLPNSKGSQKTELEKRMKKDKEEIRRVMEQYGNTIYRMSCFMLQNEQDAQDILQETLIRYMQKAPSFSSQKVEKAWLLRVADNLCKDMLRFQKRNRCINLEAIGDLADAEEEHLAEQIFALPEKYKQVIFLHYYEGYAVSEMAEILKISPGAVKKRMERGRQKLKNILQDTEKE